MMSSTKPDKKLYDIVDKDGRILPRNYKGMPRTSEEADRLLERLNKGGEYRPYKKVYAYADKT